MVCFCANVPLRTYSLSLSVGTPAQNFYSVSVQLRSALTRSNFGSDATRVPTNWRCP